MVAGFVLFKNHHIFFKEQKKEFILLLSWLRKRMSDVRNFLSTELQKQNKRHERRIEEHAWICQDVKKIWSEQTGLSVDMAMVNLYLGTTDLYCESCTSNDICLLSQ